MRDNVIVHIITGLNTGGAEMMLYKLLSNMDRSKFQPIVISLMDKGTLGERIEQLEIPVHTLGMKSSIILPHHLWKLARLVRTIKPSIVQGWMYHGNLASNLACHLAFRQVPVIWNIRGSHYDLKKLKISTAITVWLGGKLSYMPYKIINNSKESAEKHQSQIGYREDKSHIIPNGFDTNLFKPCHEARKLLRMILGVSEDSFLIGMIGRYHPVKDHFSFIKAAASLVAKDRPSNIHFVLAGRDVDWNNKELVKQIQDAKITERIHLLGERNDMHKLNAALDVATLCSISEGFPNVIGEAMACGVPCVVTEVGDSSWLVSNTGLAVPPGDTKQLENAWIEMLNMDEETRRDLGRLARQRVQQLFSIDAIAKQYESLYEEALKSAIS